MQRDPRVLFVAQNHLDALLFYDLALNLAQDGVQSRVISYMRYPATLAPPGAEVALFERYVDPSDRRWAETHWQEALDWAQVEYPGVDLDSLIFSDKALSPAFGLPRYRRNLTTGRGLVVAYLRAWERILAEFPADAIGVVE